MGVDIFECVQVIYVFLGDVDRTAPYRPDLVDVAVIEKKGKLRRDRKRYLQAARCKATRAEGRSCRNGTNMALVSSINVLVEEHNRVIASNVE